MNEKKCSLRLRGGFNEALAVIQAKHWIVMVNKQGEPEGTACHVPFINALTLTYSIWS